MRRAGTIGRYRKMHIPDDPLYYEKFYFTPGDLGFTAAETPHGSIGTLICWDQWYPEAARLTALAGAELLLLSHRHRLAVRGERGGGCSPSTTPGRRCSAHMPSPTACSWPPSTASGTEGEVRFWGQSFVADPFGRILARASSDAEELLVVECDLSHVEQRRREWPFLRDRRIDAYGELTRRFRD